MAESLAEEVRHHVNVALVEPARKAGRTQVSVVAGDVHKDLRLKNRMPAVCAAIDTSIFQQQYRVIVGKRIGPRQGSTATWILSIEK